MTVQIAEAREQIRIARDALTEAERLLAYESEPEIQVNPLLAALHELEYDKPTGAWGAKDGGRAASEKAASQARWRWDHNKRKPYSFEQYLATMEGAAQASGVPLCILLALASRESWHGYLLDANGRGDRGHGFGLMQVDDRSHQAKGGPYSIEHILQAADIFKDSLRIVEQRHPNWERKYIFKGGLITYNCFKCAQTIERMDLGSHNDDYGSDTACQAKWYSNHIGEL